MVYPVNPNYEYYSEQMARLSLSLFIVLMGLAFDVGASIAAPQTGAAQLFVGWLGDVLIFAAGLLIVLTIWKGGEFAKSGGRDGALAFFLSAGATYLAIKAKLTTGIPELGIEGAMIC